MVHVGVLGSTGRMGQAILVALGSHPRCRLSIAGTRNNLANVFENSDVVIDFTTADALVPHLDFSLSYKKPLVIGTTGLTPDHDRCLSQAAATIPLVVSP